jgi:hypothetical protein
LADGEVERKTSHVESVHASLKLHSGNFNSDLIIMIKNLKDEVLVVNQLPQMRGLVVRGSELDARVGSSVDNTPAARPSDLKVVGSFIGQAKEGKTAFFAGLTDQQKIDVLKYTRQSRRFNGTKHEGKTELFAGLTPEQKFSALTKWHANHPVWQVWPAQKGGGKTAYFASLPDKGKVEVLRRTGLEEVHRFIGQKKEGKTAFFASLPEEIKSSALTKWSCPAWKAQKGTKKTAFFASLTEEQKIDVLKCTDLGGVDRFNGSINEGKTAFFANLTEEQKCDALMRWCADPAVRPVWTSQKGTGKVGYFAGLSALQKIQVLKLTGRREVDRFTGTMKEGKVAFFASLSEEEKAASLIAWQEQSGAESDVS